MNGQIMKTKMNHLTKINPSIHFDFLEGPFQVIPPALKLKSNVYSKVKRRNENEEDEMVYKAWYRKNDKSLQQAVDGIFFY